MTSINNTHIHTHSSLNKFTTNNKLKNNKKCYLYQNYTKPFYLFIFIIVLLICRLFEFRKIISNRTSAYNLIPYDYPVEIIKVRFLNFILIN